MSLLSMTKKPERRIIFTFDDDFAEFFKEEGIDPATVTDGEWHLFENMFMSGLGDWDEISKVAVSEIERSRREE